MKSGSECCDSGDGEACILPIDSDVFLHSNYNVWDIAGNLALFYHIISFPSHSSSSSSSS